jgi:hypothetical protein
MVEVSLQAAFNLDPAVGRARVCVCRVGWLGATRQQGRPCNEKQQRQSTRQMRNRVRSVLTHSVMRKISIQANVHGVLRRKISGQLPDLGLINSDLLTRNFLLARVKRCSRVVSSRTEMGMANRSATLQRQRQLRRNSLPNAHAAAPILAADEWRVCRIVRGERRVRVARFAG